MAKLSIRRNGVFHCQPSKRNRNRSALAAFRASLPRWLVTATIGEHNNAQLVVPGADIFVAGDYAGAVLEGTACKVRNRAADYHIQSITQLV